jgi:hypothetical protein
MCIVAGDINLMLKPVLRSTLYFYAVGQRHATQQHTRNALLCLHCKTVTRTRHNFMLYVPCLSCYGIAWTFNVLKRQRIESCMWRIHQFLSTF